MHGAARAGPTSLEATFTFLSWAVAIEGPRTPKEPPCPPHSTLDSARTPKRRPSRISISRWTLDLRSGLLAVLALGLFYMAYSIRSDIEVAGGGPTTILPFILLGVALLIALGFEFVNGFHDTANAVATVIYTHALPAQVAVVWSGCWNLLGVLASTGAVAFGVVSLLPVELILQVGSAAGYAMVFALLISAIIWNLGTWWMGIPASSSHTLIGSIVGVGVANAIIRGQNGTAGVDWDQVTKVGEALLVLAAVRLCPLGAAAARDEGGHPRAGALHRPEDQQAAVDLDPRAC